MRRLNQVDIGNHYSSSLVYVAKDIPVKTCDGGGFYNGIIQDERWNMSMTPAARLAFSLPIVIDGAVA